MKKFMEEIVAIADLAAIAFIVGAAFRIGSAAGDVAGKAMAEHGLRIANERHHKTDKNATDSDKETA